jgi:hypothetical protein
MTFQEWREELEARCQEHEDSVRKKVSLQEISRPLLRTTRIYLAGKICRNDWRHDVVGRELRAAAGSIEEWRAVKSISICDGLEYVGPFFIGDDHGCGHGANSHGANGDCGTHNPRLHEEVLAKSLAGIRACDLFIVWAEKDFPTAYGTMTEIGMAKVLNKRIVIIHQGGIAMTDALRDLWFPLGCGEFVYAATPEKGILKLFEKKENKTKTQAVQNKEVEF